MTRLIDAETAKVSITRYFAVHARNLKTKHILLSQIMNNQMNEICRDVCFGLDAQQTVDAVPVVRCRNCKWKPRNMGCTVDVEKLDFPLDNESCVICPYGSDDPWYNREPDPNGFCSKGERKE